MTSLSKNVCIDKLDNIVDKYSNTLYNNQNEAYSRYCQY